MILWATLLAWLDPFGLNRNAEQYSEQLNARLEAPFYNSRAQCDIVMVLITPEALKHRGYAWPPRYEYYADTARRLLYDAPRAVFVDVLVRQARVEDGTLAYAQRELAALTCENGIPVLFGTETPGARALFSDAHGIPYARMSLLRLQLSGPARNWEDHALQELQQPDSLYQTHFMVLDELGDASTARAVEALEISRRSLGDSNLLLPHSVRLYQRAGKRERASEYALRCNASGDEQLQQACQSP